MERIILEIAYQSGVSFRLGDQIETAISCMRSPQVVNDVFALGFITMNIASPGIMGRQSVRQQPFFIGSLFDYGLEVAPRIKDEEKMIDVNGLEHLASFMRMRFGDVNVPQDFVTRIGQFAQLHINNEEAKRAAAPGQNASADNKD